MVGTGSGRFSDDLDMNANSHLRGGIDRRRHAGRLAIILCPRDAQQRKNNALPEHEKWASMPRWPVRGDLHPDRVTTVGGNSDGLDPLFLIAAGRFSGVGI